MSAVTSVCWDTVRGRATAAHNEIDQQHGDGFTQIPLLSDCWFWKYFSNFLSCQEAKERRFLILAGKKLQILPPFVCLDSRTEEPACPLTAEEVAISENGKIRCR